MLLAPAGKDYLWGGERLRTEYGKALPQQPLAETWECSVHPDGPSRVVSGQFAGQGLDEVLGRWPELLGGKCRGEKLPVLIKFIDAQKDLSVQVHPDDAFAREFEQDNGKSEMWYVLDAQPGATLVYGFAHPVTPALLRQAAAEGTLEKHLQRVPVHKGDVFFIPAGTVHAIGAGVLVAEIQESSNVTYRLYDYDRLDKNGQKRPLQLEKAMRVLQRGASPRVRQPQRLMHYSPGSSRELLVRCRYFETEHVCCVRGFSFAVGEASFQVLLCLEGTGTVCAPEGGPLPFHKGDCIFLPASLGRCQVQGRCELLKVRC